MDKSDADAKKDQSVSSAPTGGSSLSTPGRPGRRRKPPRHRPPPRGHVSGATALSGTAQNRFGFSANRATTVRPVVPTTRSEIRDATTTHIPLRRQLPGGHTSAIIRTRPTGSRRRPGARRRVNRRRSTTTPAPEVTTDVSATIGPSGTTGISGVTSLSGTGPSATTETTAPGARRRGRLGKRRRIPGGFRQRGRTRLRRPGRKNTTTDTTGQGLAEHQSDAIADSTLERPQFVDTGATSPSGDGLLREPSTFDTTTVRPDPVRRAPSRRTRSTTTSAWTTTPADS